MMRLRHSMLLVCILQVWWGAQSQGPSEGGRVRTHRDVQGGSQVSSPGGQPRVLPHLSPATPHAPPQGTPPSSSCASHV